MRLFRCSYPLLGKQQLFAALAGALLAVLTLPAIALSQSQPQKVTGNIETPGASSNVRELTQMDGVLYFFANHAMRENVGLWRSDGTEEGTTLVREFDNVVYFTGYDQEHGKELWQSDGTPEGTHMVFDLLSSTASSSPTNLIANDGVFYFLANSGTQGKHIWRYRPRGKENLFLPLIFTRQS